MAKVETLFGCKSINIGASVGKGGANNKKDVLVIQAMLKYVMEYKSHFFKNVVPPQVSGIMDMPTIKLIERYQRYIRRHTIIRVSVDGRIDPAKGVFVTDRKRLSWTIGHLNSEAMEAHMILNKGGGSNHVEGICNLYPQVEAILDGTAVGSLNLGLE